MFDVKVVKKDLVNWVRETVLNGGGKKVVIGISGGKDSSVVAALCVEALGKENVVGVLMPQGEQFDIQYSYDLCNHLGIKYHVVNIGEPVKEMTKQLEQALGEPLSVQAKTNLPARVRMLTLYGVAQTMEHARVANTCNLSEDWVGYATKYGDNAGDFSPLQDFTVGEVKAIGRELGLPAHLVDKTPIDGLCGKTDEDNLGFTYAMLDKYIREGVCENPAIKDRIDRLHRYNLHKLQLMPKYHYNNAPTWGISHL